VNQHNLIAIDLAKNVFQVCGMNARQKVTFNRQLRRTELAAFMQNQPPLEVAMEACYSSHYWGRCFEAMGHTVSLLPAQHVAPFVRGNKSDHNDALAIAEAAHRPHITPVPIKTVEQQDIQALHRLRERYVSERTALINQTRGLLSEYGIITPLGHKAFCVLLREVSQPGAGQLSPVLKIQVSQITEEYYGLTNRVKELTDTLKTLAVTNPLCERLMTIPGIGVINATAIVSAIGNGSQFANGREFAVWLGLTPRQFSSGESFKSTGITKRGNRYLRKQLVHGARAVLSRSKQKTDPLSRWINQLVARRGVQKACVALAARLARIAWVLLQREEAYKVMP
jgi:transposase